MAQRLQSQPRSSAVLRQHLCGQQRQQHSVPPRSKALGRSQVLLSAASYSLHMWQDTIEVVSTNHLITTSVFWYRPQISQLSVSAFFFGQLPIDIASLPANNALLATLPFYLNQRVRQGSNFFRKHYLEFVLNDSERWATFGRTNVYIRVCRQLHCGVGIPCVLRALFRDCGFILPL